MKFRAIAFALILAAVAFTQVGSTNNAPRPNGWLVRPLGRNTQLGGFPMSTALSPDGQFLLVLSPQYSANPGEANPSNQGPTIRVFSTKTEREISSMALANPWLGLAFSPNGRLFYVSGTNSIFEMQLSPEGELGLGRNFTTADPKDPKTDQLIGDVAVSPDGRMLYAADVLHDQVLVINLSSGRVIERYAAGRRPYRIAFHPNGKTYFVTGWADGSLTQYDALTGRRQNGIGVAAHATDIAWRDKKTQLEEGEEAPWAARLFIPAANTNNVYAAAITEAGELRIVDRIALGLFVDSPVGMTPSAVALSPDQNRLYVVCSDANALAVVDVSGVKGRLLGFIPTGEYPTAVRTLNDGRIVVLNGASNNGGSVLFINPPADAALRVPTGIVIGNSPLKDIDPRQRPIAMNAIPFTPGEPTPIEHVVYILRDGPPHTTAGEQAAPNQFKLAREFTALPNFVATGATTLDGFYWSTAGIVPDFIRKLQPALHNSQLNINELDVAAQPPAGYLWNQIGARLYGIVPTARAARGVVVAAPQSNGEFKAPDRDTTDVARAQAFLKELSQFEQQQNMPKLLMLRLAGDRPGTARTAPADAADTDYALGLIIERLSHSKFWPKMAVFIAGTNAADHRASALVVSPFATRGKSPTGTFNTLSVLRTIEHILGLSPMTQFDAGATPLDDAFQLTPDLRPYDAERPRITQ